MSTKSITNEDKILKIVTELKQQMSDFKKEVKADITKNEDKILKIATDLTELKQQMTDFKKEMSDFKKEMSDLKEEMTDFKKEVKTDINRLESTTNTISAELSTTKDLFNKYIKKDATQIERELKVVIKGHFKDIYNNIKFQDLPMKNFYSCDDNLITEFDYGAFIKFYDDKIINTLIVEAKHYIKKEKIVTKLYQIHTIIQTLTEIKYNELLPIICKYNFKKMIDTYNDNKTPLDNSIEPNKILLYIGGPNWEDGSFELIKRIQSDSDENLMNLSSEIITKYRLKNIDKKDFYKTLLIMRDTIGAIKPSDDKKYYIVHDRISLKSVGGGKNKKYKMINLL